MFFDIGANVGNWSLHNIKMLDCNKIISVEASPITFQILSTNIHLLNNSIRVANKKIECLNYAVCANEGKDITFYHCPNSNVLSTMNKKWLTDTSSRFYNTPYIEIKCKTITLDNLISTYGIPHLIKIDVEGGEFECIKSLSQKVENLCFEWASETNDITFKCLDYLVELGFKYFFIQSEDNYTFRPSNYTDVSSLKQMLLTTIPKKDWGMIWCR
jgi:FkbM family methyltransferase